MTIKKPVLFIDDYDIKSSLSYLIDEEVPFEITEEMVEKVVEQFKWRLENLVSEEIDNFFANFEKIFEDAVWDTLYEYALEKIGQTYNENVWKKFKRNKNDNHE